MSNVFKKVEPNKFPPECVKMVPLHSYQCCPLKFFLMFAGIFVVDKKLFVITALIERLMLIIEHIIMIIGQLHFPIWEIHSHEFFLFIFHSSVCSSISVQFYVNRYAVIHVVSVYSLSLLCSNTILFPYIW